MERVKDNNIINNHMNVNVKRLFKMCYNNKYTLWHISIIEKSLKRNHKKIVNDGFERHHILPQSCGGDNSKSNLVALTPREHFMVHLLLIKMFRKEEHQNKMIFALMNMRADNGLYSRNNTSRIYEYFKLKWQKLQSKRMKKYMSVPENRKNMSIKLKDYFKAQEPRDHLSKIFKGKKRPDYNKGSILLKGDDRTERQKQAALNHSKRMIKNVPWNKGLRATSPGKISKINI